MTPGPAAATAISGAHHAVADLSAAAIPYARAPAVSVGATVSAVLLTFGLLAAIAIGLWLARRHGWLRPWLGARDAAPQTEALKVITGTRLSPTARALVLEYEGSQFLVVESSQHLVMRQHPVRGRENSHDA